MQVVITGPAGFIGSCVAHYYYDKVDQLILVDNFERLEKKRNWDGLDKAKYVDRKDFINWLEEDTRLIDFIIHLGARTDTTEFKKPIFDELNLEFSKDIWRYCSLEEIPLIYASSAATYGLGEHGYVDNHEIVSELKPLNPYGDSKNDFDKWALKEFIEPPHWFGFKFFNVFGPNEYHKGRMASVVYHFYKQIRETGQVNLFRSHKEDVADGEQQRDFIYVLDLIKVIDHFFNNYADITSGLYNLGTGQARSYNALAEAIFKALDIEADINYIDTPEDIRDKYQYFTEADMTKVESSGYKNDFMNLESSIAHYLENYLTQEYKQYSPE